MVKNEQHKSHDRIFTYAVGFAWFAYVVYSISKHSMFRDEQNAWQLAKNPNSIFEMLGNSRYEGRPPTYFLILRGLSLVSNAPEAIKAVSIVCAAISGFVILNKLRVHLYLRILLLLTFPFSGVYFVFVREYSLVILLLVLICWIALDGKLMSVLGVFLIGLLMFVNLFGLMMGISITMYLIFQSTFDRRKTKMSAMFLSLVAGLSILLMIPPGDTTFVGNQLGEETSTILRTFVYKIAQIFFPFNQQTWSDKIRLYAFAFSVLFLLAIGYSFWKTSRPVFIAFFVYSGLFFSNVAIGYAWYWWHFGMYQSFVLILIVLSISTQKSKTILKKNLMIPGAITAAFCGISVLSSFIGPGEMMFTNQEFSNAKRAATAIQKLCALDECFIAATDHAIGVPLAGYLNQPVFFLDKGHFGSFFDWKTESRAVDPWSDLIDLSLPSEMVVLASSVPLTDADRYLFIEAFSDAVWENYWLYVVRL